MEQKIIAKAKFMKGSPRKIRLVADAVRHLSPTKAVTQLKFLPQNGAKTILRVLNQAIANAKNNFKLSPDGLSISSILVNEGPRFKRQDVHAHGARFGSGTRHKKLTHITVELKYGTKS